MEAIYDDRQSAISNVIGLVPTTLEPKKRRNSASASRFLGSTDNKFLTPLVSQQFKARCISLNAYRKLMLPRPSPAMSAVFDELASDASSPYLDVTLAQQYKPRVRHTGVSARPKPYQLHRDLQMDPVLSPSCSIFSSCSSSCSATGINRKQKIQKSEELTFPAITEGVCCSSSSTSSSL